MKRKNLKSIVEKYLKEVSEYVKSGENISNSVKKVFAKHGEQYEDSHRRCFSKALEKEEITDNKVKSLPIEHTEEYKDALNRCLSKSKYYLITWAQADTGVHERFWENLKAYANFIGAEIIVQAGRYKNPNSIESSNNIKSKEKNKNIWDSRLKDYLYASRLDLNNMLSVLCDVKIQPTTAYPINGINGFTGMRTSIVPHPKVQLKSLPVLRDYPQKIVLSTGACTHKNYTDTGIGKKGEFEHEYGFVVAEIVDDNEFYVRQVQADNSGSFYDLWNIVKNGEVTDFRKIDNPNIEYPFIVWGDLHLSQEDESAVNAAKELTNTLRSKNVIAHDLFDGVSVNPHSEKDPFRMLEKEEQGEDVLEDEIDNMIDWLEKMEKELNYSTIHIVASNHNDFLDRFLKNSDWRKSRNKKLYLELSYIKSQGLAPKGIVSYLIDKRFEEGGKIKTYRYGDSLRIKNWELGLHYDKGANGSRGSITQFKDLPTKTIGAHGHCAQRYGGAIMTPTLTKLQLDYNSDSLSSWVQGVTQCYPNGKASQIIFINGKYTTL